MTNTSGQATPALTVHGVSKRFGRNLALNDVSLTVAAGEIRGVIGRNGAGKSTLMGILSGFLPPDGGEVRLGGRDTRTMSLAEYRAYVGMVHQHSTLVSTLSIAENVFLGTTPPQRAGLIDRRAMNVQVQAMLDDWASGLSADTLVGALTLAQRQLVEIIRELARGVKLVILDEPTSRLEKHGLAELFANIREVSARGTAVIYISHHLAEIHELCKSVTVLRDGQLVATHQVADVTEDDLVTDMVGADAETRFARMSPLDVEADSPPVLQISSLAVGALEPFDLEVRAGECVGIAGLIGSGKEDLGLVLGGLMVPSGGTISVNGTPVRVTVRGVRAAGIGFLPPDRHDTGLVLSMSIRENITMTVWDRLKNVLGFLIGKLVAERARELEAETGVAAIGDDHQPVGSLSGGNQQKVALGRAIAADPDVLVLMNPTTGVDIASKRTIYELVQKQLGAGRAAILISDEPDEFTLCNRTVALFRGRVTSVFIDAADELALVSAIEGVGAPHVGN
ncbi:sugar ABC transporter ATP-binding protein [Microbacterium sp.]|uniref:sugar ABC transporter ATP-binding protein n=1 Tax=Microbacterium sp. TaxID=51671 RepID=UPI003A944A84